MYYFPLILNPSNTKKNSTMETEESAFSHFGWKKLPEFGPATNAGNFDDLAPKLLRRCLRFLPLRFCSVQEHKSRGGCVLPPIESPRDHIPTPTNIFIDLFDFRRSVSKIQGTFLKSGWLVKQPLPVVTRTIWVEKTLMKPGEPNNSCLIHLVFPQKVIQHVLPSFISLQKRSKFPKTTFEYVCIINSYIYIRRILAPYNNKKNKAFNWKVIPQMLQRRRRARTAGHSDLFAMQLWSLKPDCQTSFSPWRKIETAEVFWETFFFQMNTFRKPGLTSSNLRIFFLGHFSN